jgi:hypothetical protein
MSPFHRVPRMLSLYWVVGKAQAGTQIAGQLKRLADRLVPRLRETSGLPGFRQAGPDMWKLGQRHHGSYDSDGMRAGPPCRPAVSSTGP